MCGLETMGSKTRRINDLCAVEPLEDGAFERAGDRDVWHPNWAGKIDDDVNMQFIKAVGERIWQNEQVSIHFFRRTDFYLHCAQRIRDKNNGKGEINDTDFQMSVITSCVKNYWRNVHKQHAYRNDPEKHEQLLNNGKHRGRRQKVSQSCLSAMVMLNPFWKRTNARRQAAEVHCTGIGIPVKEVMAMLDTDFASDPQTCVEDEDFSDDMKERRIRAGVGEKAHMAIGQTWRSTDVSD